MNQEQLQHVIREVISRLQHRAERAVTLSVTQLQDAQPRTLFCQYAALRVVQVDLPFLEHIAQATPGHTAAVFIHNALAWGLQVQLCVQRRLLPAIPLKKLSRLPLVLCDEQGQNVMLHSGDLLSYRDIAGCSDGILLLRRKCVVTALARDAARARHIQLMKQE